MTSGKSQKAFKLLLKASTATALSLAIAGCGDHSRGGQEQLQQHLKQASAYTIQGQYRAAIIEAKNAIQESPDSLDAHITLANILVDMGQYHQAIQQLEQIPEEQHTDNYLITLAKAYAGYGKFKSALNTLAKVADQTSAEANLVKADTLLKLGEVTPALNTYSAVLDVQPDNTQARLGLAQAYAEQNQYQKSFKLLQELKAAQPNDPEIAFFEAKLAAGDGDLNQAEELLTNALQYLPNTDVITPVKANILRALTEVLSRQGRPNEAMIYTKILSEAFPGMEVATGQYEEALQHAKIGELDKASDILESLIEKYPGFSKATELLATINYLRGNQEEAAEYFEKDYDPELATDTTNQIALINSIKMNNPNEVVSILENADDLESNPTKLALYGTALLKTGATDKGVATLQKAINLYPQDTHASILLADYYNSISPPKPETALNILNAAYAENPTDINILRTLSLQLLLIKQPDSAEQIIDRALKNSPDSADTYVLAGQFNQGIGKSSKALIQFQTATDLDPKNRLAWQGLGATQLKSGDAEHALRSFIKAIEIDDSAPQVFKGYLLAAEKSGQIQQALERTESAFKQRKNFVALTALVDFYVSKKDFDTAYKSITAGEEVFAIPLKELRTTTALQQSLSAISDRNYKAAKEAAMEGLSYSPNSASLLKALAKAEIMQDEFSNAIAVANQLASARPELAAEIRGDAALKQNDLSTALAEYKSAWNIKPSSQLGKQIFLIFKQSNANDQATAFMNEWLTKIPSSSTANTLQAHSYLSEKNYQDAIPLLEDLASRQSNNVSHINNLAWAYLEIGDSRAEEMARKAHALAPNDPTILDTLGWIMVKKGETQEGLQHLRKAAELSPKNTAIQQHLSEAENQL